MQRFPEMTPLAKLCAPPSPEDSKKAQWEGDRQESGQVSRSF